MGGFRCGHCKHLAPEYAKAAARAKQLEPPVYLAKVDADHERDLAQKFQVQGFPTLYVFRNGVRSDYNGPRDADGIFDFVNRNYVPPAARVNTPEEVLTAAAETQTLVLGLFRYALFSVHILKKLRGRREHLD